MHFISRFMPKPRNIPAPENDNIAGYDDVKALSLYDVRSIVTAHADVFAKALYPPAECDGITVLTEILREDGRIARDIIWRVTNLSPEEVDRLPEWEIRRFVIFAICRTHRTAEAGRRVRRAIIASVNAVCKGRNLAAPLGLKVIR